MSDQYISAAAHPDDAVPGAYPYRHHKHGSAVSWSAIFAGAAGAAALSLILLVLGTGLGLSSVSPWSQAGITAATFGISTVLWLTFTQIAASGIGGYLAGRLRRKWVDVHADESYFRDTAHGFLAWALATLLVVGTLGSAISGIIGSGVQAASTVASGAAMGASANASGETADNATSYFVDSLFRQAPGTTATNPDTAAAAASEAGRILITSAAAGEVSADDKAYLAQLVSTRTGLSQPDAQARVDAVLGRIEAAKVQAQEAADTARKAGATAALLGALSLVIGAFVASAAAALGGKQRDDEETVYSTRR